MLQIGNLHPPKGSVKKSIRRGRGEASGKGKTSGRGHKGALARSGAKRARAFEGGQMPLFRRVPKRGFMNPFRVQYAVINIADLNRFQANDEINPKILHDRGMVRKALPVKLLGNGEIRFPVKIQIHAASESAKKKIAEAGGVVEVLS